MSTISQPLRLAVVRPAHPARRALLAIAEALARIALHRADPHAAAMRADVAAEHERRAVRMLAVVPPLR